ncbi:hypothetical protein [Sulfitobacter sp.]|uniref:hypothetical protein n=1 Tax=Sulfitobacter sp. TaxID=1903071 RepID=UPI0035659786|tara:strand:- start:526 stop:822 length:297 start_codon:yes stop_codon:yes gene_type:complete
MNGTLALLIAVLAVLMLASGWCGYSKRFLGFLGVLVVGLVLNGAWMIWGLGAKPFETPVIAAQMAAVGYALCAFGTGWLIGRLVRQLRATRVEKGANT